MQGLQVLFRVVDRGSGTRWWGTSSLLKSGAESGVRRRALRPSSCLAGCCGPVGRDRAAARWCGDRSDKVATFPTIIGQAATPWPQPDRPAIVTRQRNRATGHAFRTASPRDGRSRTRVTLADLRSLPEADEDSGLHARGNRRLIAGMGRVIAG